MVPGNNSTIEPEIWRVIPRDTALYASRLMLKGDITRENLKSMEKEVDRAAAELMATVVHVMMIADMVVSFIMEADWNDRRTAALREKWGVPALTGWTAMRDALSHLGIGRFVTISPYPKYLQDLAAPVLLLLGQCSYIPRGRAMEYFDIYPIARSNLIPGVGHITWGNAQGQALTRDAIVRFVDNVTGPLANEPTQSSRQAFVASGR